MVGHGFGEEQDVSTLRRVGRLEWAMTNSAANHPKQVARLVSIPARAADWHLASILTHGDRLFVYWLLDLSAFPASVPEPPAPRTRVRARSDQYERVEIGPAS